MEFALWLSDHILSNTQRVLEELFKWEHAKAMARAKALRRRRGSFTPAPRPALARKGSARDRRRGRVQHRSPADRTHRVRRPAQRPLGPGDRARQQGPVAGSLLVGNFGDGRISIYPKVGHHFARHASGQVLDEAPPVPPVRGGVARPAGETSPMADWPALREKSPTDAGQRRAVTRLRRGGVARP